MVVVVEDRHIDVVDEGVTDDVVVDVDDVVVDVVVDAGNKGKVESNIFFRLDKKKVKKTRKDKKCLKERERKREKWGEG